MAFIPPIRYPEEIAMKAIEAQYGGPNIEQTFLKTLADFAKQHYGEKIAERKEKKQYKKGKKRRIEETPRMLLESGKFKLKEDVVGEILTDKGEMKRPPTYEDLEEVTTGRGGGYTGVFGQELSDNIKDWYQEKTGVRPNTRLDLRAVENELERNLKLEEHILDMGETIINSPFSRRDVVDGFIPLVKKAVNTQTIDSLKKDAETQLREKGIDVGRKKRLKGAIKFLNKQRELLLLEATFEEEMPEGEQIKEISEKLGGGESDVVTFE